MSLIDELRKVADYIPPSHLPTSNEISGVLGALIGATEHGLDSLLKAAEKDAEDVASTEVAKIFGKTDQPAASPSAAAASSPPGGAAAPAPADVPPPPPPPAPADVPSTDKTPAELQDEIVALQQQVATLVGQLNKTQVGPASADAPAPAPAADVPPAAPAGVPSSPESPPAVP